MLIRLGQRVPCLIDFHKLLICFQVGTTAMQGCMYSQHVHGGTLFAVVAMHKLDPRFDSDMQINLRCKTSLLRRFESYGIENYVLSI